MVDYGDFPSDMAPWIDKMALIVADMVEDGIPVVVIMGLLSSICNGIAFEVTMRGLADVEGMEKQ